MLNGRSLCKRGGASQQDNSSGRRRMRHGRPGTPRRKRAKTKMVLHRFSYKWREKLVALWRSVYCAGHYKRGSAFCREVGTHRTSRKIGRHGAYLANFPHRIFVLYSLAHVASVVRARLDSDLRLSDSAMKRLDALDEGRVTAWNPVVAP